MAVRLFESNIDLNKYQLLNAVIQVLGSAPSSPNPGQVYYSSADTTFYGWNGSSWLNLGSAGVTDLTFSRDGTTVTIISSTGTDAILPAATTSLAGVMSATDKTKLDGIATSANNYSHPNHTGDVTSTGDGATAIANNAVTLAKMADVATGTVFYRKTAATGDPEVQTLATLKTDLGLTGTNSGDQTSIVGITGTKAQFDTAVTDGNFLYVGDITSYTDEQAQDAVGGMVDSSLTYVDGTPLLQRAALTGAITASAGSNTTSLGSFTTAQLNTALSDNDVATGGGTATGTNTGDQNAAGVSFDNTATGFVATTVQAAINEAKVYSDNLVVGGLINKGGYNASTNTPDLDTTPIGGIKNGWTYVVTAAGTFFSEAVQIGDMLIAKQDAPTTLAHWTVVNKNIPDIVNASETEAGLVEEATDAEITAGTNTGGTGAKLVVVPGKLRTYLNTATAGLSNAVKYTTTVGDGSSTTIAVTHNIGKQFNTVQVFQTGSPFAQIECEVRATSTTQTTFIFNTAPTSNQYTVVITG